METSITVIVTSTASGLSQCCYVGLYVSMDSLILIVTKQEYDNQKKLFRLGWG